MLNVGLSLDQMKDLCSRISDGKTTLDVPPYTTMDQKYSDAEIWLKQQHISPNNPALAQALVNEIYTLGSGENEVAGLKTWAQNFLTSSTFKNAFPDAENTFCNIVGIAPPPLTGLAFWDNEISQYYNTRNNDYQTLLSELGIPPNPLPTDPAGWRRLTRMAKQLEERMEQAGNSKQAWDALAITWGLKPSNDIHVLMQEAQARLTGYERAMDGASDQAAVNLLGEALKEIRNLESKGGSLAQLAQWANSINLSNFPDLPPEDLQEFEKLKKL